MKVDVRNFLISTIYFCKQEQGDDEISTWKAIYFHPTLRFCYLQTTHSGSGYHDCARARALHMAAKHGLKLSEASQPVIALLMVAKSASLATAVQKPGRI